MEIDREQALPMPQLTIWDSTDQPPEHMGMVYCWNGYSETESVHSLLRYVEINSLRLRSKYLAWIHDLGESRINGRRLIDHFAFKDGLSYWWMTLFVEKSLYKSPLSDAIRLLALDEIVKEQKPGKVYLCSANRVLHKAVRGLCRSMSIAYEWKKFPAQLHRLNLRSIYRTLPQSVRALPSLARYLYRCWRLRSDAKTDWFEGDNAVCFCSYFINLDQASCANSKYYSQYWDGLPKLMHDLGFRLNWIQHYLKSNIVPDTKVAIGWIKGFNRERHEEGFHAFLYTFLTMRSVWCILKRWLWLNWITRQLGDMQEAFRPQGCIISLWPLMRGDWHASMHGPVAIGNLLFIELFDQLMSKIPHQEKGFYLCENQSWERALIHAWRKYGHGRLVGVVHSTVRFWDLRHFNDPQTIRSIGARSLPQPDLMALNGRAAVDEYLSVEYPRRAIVEVEALRYGYLSKLIGVPSKRQYGKKIKILVLGEYKSEANIKLMKLLDAAAPINPGNFDYFVKPHPACPVRVEDFPLLKLTVVTQPLGEIIKDYDVAYASNDTSAAVDAYLAGVPTVVMLDDAELNFSPLFNKPGVRFVSTPEKLSEALQEIIQDSESKSTYDPGEFFFLGSELTRWRLLLSND